MSETGIRIKKLIVNPEILLHMGGTIKIVNHGIPGDSRIRNLWVTKAGMVAIIIEHPSFNEVAWDDEKSIPVLEPPVAERISD